MSVFEMYHQSYGVLLNMLKTSLKNIARNKRIWKVLLKLRGVAFHKISEKFEIIFIYFDVIFKFVVFLWSIWTKCNPF